jgi:hypothetical protein
MVSESDVMAAVLLILTPSSLKKGLFELITVAKVTPPVPPPLLVTVRESVAVRVSPPPVPLTVTVVVPVTAVAEAVKVRVLVPAVEAGLNTAVTPVGKPLALKVTLLANPPLGVTVTVLVPVAPCFTVAFVADRAKFGVATGVTFKLMTAVCVRPRAVLVPVMVTLTVPVAAVPEAVNVSVLVAVVEAGLKAAVTPVGKTPTLSPTLPLNPPVGVTVIVLAPVPPCCTVALVPDSEKLGVTTGVTFKLMTVVCVRLRAALVPVIATLTVPVAAVLEAVNVSALVPVVDAGLKAAVTPAGRVPTLSATLPLNPPRDATLMVLVPVPPWATLAFVPDRAKSGVEA